MDPSSRDDSQQIPRNLPKLQKNKGVQGDEMKAWIDYSLIEEKDLRANDIAVKLDEGCMGFLPVWKSKAAAKRAGHKDHSRFRRAKSLKPTPSEQRSE
jgi:hypothetical protein